MTKIRVKPTRRTQRSSKPEHCNINSSHILTHTPIHHPVSIAFTKRSRIVSFEDSQDSMLPPKDVTSSFLNSEFTFRKAEKPLMTTNIKTPKTLSRLSRSGCLKSMAQELYTQPVTPSTVSDESSSSSDNNEEETELYSRWSLYENLDSVSSTWGQFVDVIPIDTETSLSKKRRLIISRRKSSSANNIYHYAPYSLPSSRPQRHSKNDSYFYSTQRYKNTALTDQISESLCQMRM
mmetsp:Transcript_7570/g.7135  ORF Transcript_7570/g.7135 Transcript_7570/m.7135 type:complete len:235 (-) Transcript_7570:73-777(-)